MKKMKKSLLSSLVLALAISTVSFALPGINNAKASESVSVRASSYDLVPSSSSVTIERDKEKKITLKYNGKKLDASKADWESDDTDIADVDSDGVIKGIKTGQTTITVKYKSEKAKIDVKVIGSSGLEANYSKVTVQKGRTQTITLTYGHNELDPSKATWSSSNTSVATVSNGVVTAKANGRTTIRAKYNNETVSIWVTVDNNGKLEANDTSITLKKGKEETIKLTYDGKSISGSKATWSSSKESVAIVDDGVITAKGKGTATITAKYEGERVEIEVKVTDSGSSSLEADETSITLKKGDRSTIKLTYDGKSVSGSKATWSTSKSSVATVDNGVITAKSNGKATITAKYKGERVEIEVTVNDSGGGLEADDTRLSLRKGDRETITLTYDGKKLTGSKAKWSSSNSSIATVKDGVVTAKKAGSATITAKYKGDEVQIRITVK